MDFLEFLESIANSKGNLSFKNNVHYLHLLSLWNLPVYFQIRQARNQTWMYLNSIFFKDIKILLEPLNHACYVLPLNRVFRMALTILERLMYY